MTHFIRDARQKLVELERWLDRGMHRLVGSHPAEVTTATVARDGNEASSPSTLVLALPDGSTHGLTDERTDIGSLPDVRDHRGWIVRRNVVCLTGGTGSTVSRAHAHIIRSDADGEEHSYILHDDGSTYGTRIVRRGQTIAVHPGAPGVRLRDGDEVYFGESRALVRVEPDEMGRAAALRPSSSPVMAGGARGNPYSLR